MVDQEITARVRAYLGELSAEGIDPSFAVVFGSYATGHATEWSDIDVVVVARRFDATIRWDDVSVLWCVAARVDSRIEPIACGERQWTEDDSSAIIEIARREGQRIDVEEVELPHI
jgi:predicted nucleotidyltransferase